MPPHTPLWRRTATHSPLAPSVAERAVRLCDRTGAPLLACSWSSQIRPLALAPAQALLSRSAVTQRLPLSSRPPARASTKQAASARDMRTYHAPTARLMVASLAQISFEVREEYTDPQMSAQSRHSMRYWAPWGGPRQARLRF